MFFSLKTLDFSIIDFRNAKRTQEEEAAVIDVMDTTLALSKQDARTLDGTISNIQSYLINTIPELNLTLEEALFFYNVFPHTFPREIDIVQYPQNVHNKY